MEAKEAKPKLKKGFWKPEEDLILRKYVEIHGEGKWRTVSEKSGLKRGGRSCRLRWKNYLRPNIKRGEMSEQEKDLIIRLHKLLGNRWSLIAGRLPGRTDNEVKNYWNTHLHKVVSGDKTKEQQQQQMVKSPKPQVPSSATMAKTSPPDDKETEKMNHQVRSLSLQDFAQIFWDEGTFSLTTENILFHPFVGDDDFQSFLLL
ncbi:hypothetical protein M9H77_02144 [Catharanthus roseus]|uniref:Uncharacterized protein n=1 Tax=Catharanthus roseus TaxID=4058 RepID=A0ACC0C7K4_CATRO|nr:hypothetical protein M9H77_02144 [Catharanthus roseus]